MFGKQHDPYDDYDESYDDDMPRGRSQYGCVALGVALFILGGLGYFAVSNMTVPVLAPTSTLPVPTNSPTLTLTNTPSPTPTIPPTLTPIDTPIPVPTPTPTLSEIIERLTPSTILIEVKNADGSRSRGSGVIYNQQGYAITNAHVVDGSVIVKVFIPGINNWLSAQVLGINPCDDLAIIDIEGEGFMPAVLGDSSSLRLSDTVLVLGYPWSFALGDDLAVTQGVISKLHMQLSHKVDLIQTDAPINAGNSGGPLVNIRGEIIGINVAKIADERVEGVGFAIDINFAKPIIEELAQGKNLYWFGLTTTAGNSGKLLVEAVTSGSPAESAGFLSGDVLLTVQEASVNSQADFCDVLKSNGPDAGLKIDLMRGNERLTKYVGKMSVIGNIVFSAEVTENDESINPSASFPAGTTTVHAVFDYSYISSGMEFKSIWYRNGEEIPSVTAIELWSEAPSGSYRKGIHREGGLISAHYDLELYVNGRLVQTGSFVIRE